MFTEEERAKWRERVARWRNGELVYDAGRVVEKSDNTSVQKQEPVAKIKRDFIAEAQAKHAAEAIGPDTRSSYQQKQSLAAKQYANQQYLKAKDDAKRAEGLELMMATVSPSTYVEAATGLDLGTAGRLITDAAVFGVPGLIKRGISSIAKGVANYRYPLGIPRVPENFLTVKPQVRTKIGDVEIDNPGLYYHQSDAGKAKNFVSTGKMRTPLEEYWLAKEEAGEKIPLVIRSGIKPGYPQDPGSAMFSQGSLWYGLTPNKPDLLVTAREMPIANKNASIMSNKASLRKLEEQGTRRVTNDNIYTQGPHNRQNTTAYIWEPGYGYRKVFAEETPATISWKDAQKTTVRKTGPTYKITEENAAKITPEQWTTAQDAAIARGDMAEAQRLRDLHFKVSAPDTLVIDDVGNPQLVYHKTPEEFTVFDNNRSVGKLNWFATPNAYGENGVFATGAGKNPRTMKLYVNMRNAHKPTIDEGIEPAYINEGEDGILGIVDENMTNYFPSSNKAGKGFMISGGVDNPYALKSANAITYDNKGIRIPLGERDNFNMSDIRYGITPLFAGGAGYSLYNKYAE